MIGHVQTVQKENVNNGPRTVGYLFGSEVVSFNDHKKTFSFWFPGDLLP
jgi:hypothetical protein